MSMYVVLVVAGAIAAPSARPLEPSPALQCTRTYHHVDSSEPSPVGTFACGANDLQVKPCFPERGVPPPWWHNDQNPGTSSYAAHLFLFRMNTSKLRRDSGRGAKEPPDCFFRSGRKLGNAGCRCGTPKPTQPKPPGGGKSGHSWGTAGSGTYIHCTCSKCSDQRAY